MQNGRGLIVALAVLLAACGGGSGGENPPAAATGEVAAPEDLTHAPASAGSSPAPGPSQQEGGTPGAAAAPTADSTQPAGAAPAWPPPAAATGAGGADSNPPGPAASDPQAHSPVGVWSGATDTGRSLKGFILADGSYYVFYTRTDSLEPGGMVQGTWRLSGGTLRSHDARDFNVEDVPVMLRATVTAQAHTRERLSGSIQSGPLTTSFSSDYQAASGVSPSLHTLAGTFTGELRVGGAREATSITVGADGRFTGFAGSHCTIAGTVEPRADGGVYDLQLGFGPAPCPHGGRMFEGIGYLDTVSRVLLGGAVRVDAPTDEAVLFFGRDVDPSLGQK